MCEAVLSLSSAVVGGLLVIVGQWLSHKWSTKEDRERDEGRRILLRQMLDNPKYDWRKLSTLSRVIGASPEETARLLLEIGARGSEKDGEEDKWGYIKDHPLPEKQ